MDLHATAKHYQEGINHPKRLHVVMALRGRFKNEVGELEHLKPLAVETKSGLKVGVWFKRMLSWYESRGVTRGPVFWDSRGNWARAGRYEWAILTELEWLQKLTDGFCVSRSFWRGSCSQAMNMGVSQPSIDLNNRWRSDEGAKGKKDGSLHGHPSGDWQVYGVFGGVVTGGGLGRTIFFVLCWERRFEG